jgi:hypothetical protein
MFAKMTLEERRESDLEEAEFTLLDASKQLEYYEAVAEAMKARIARLEASPTKGVL